MDGVHRVNSVCSCRGLGISVVRVSSAVRRCLWMDWVSISLACLGRSHRKDSALLRERGDRGNNIAMIYLLRLPSISVQGRDSRTSGPSLGKLSHHGFLFFFGVSQSVCLPSPPHIYHSDERPSHQSITHIPPCATRWSVI